MNKREKINSISIGVYIINILIILMIAFGIMKGGLLSEIYFILGYTLVPIIMNLIYFINFDEINKDNKTFNRLVPIGHIFIIGSILLIKTTLGIEAEYRFSYWLYYAIFAIVIFVFGYKIYKFNGEEKIKSHKISFISSIVAYLAMIISFVLLLYFSVNYMYL